MASELKIENFKKELESLFPGLITFVPVQNLSEKNKVVSLDSIHFNISPENNNLSKSSYRYLGNELVHFTSIQALNSILNERALRLYNLHTLNDPREFTFASKFFRLNDDIIEDAKDNLFLMSFCEPSILTKSSKEFSMWRLYGNQGKGVSIKFKIVNKPEKWYDFHISKVYYGTDNRNKFKEIFKLLKLLNKTGPKIELDLGKLYTFHKSLLFRSETEVRLLFDRRKIRTGMLGKTISSNEQVIFPIIKSDLFKLMDNNLKTQYLKIPLHSNNQISSDEDTPLLKINEIQIGYHFGDEREKIIKLIEQLCEENLGYTPIVGQTRLRQFYIGNK